MVPGWNGVSFPDSELIKPGVRIVGVVNYLNHPLSEPQDPNISVSCCLSLTQDVPNFRLSLGKYNLSYVIDKDTEGISHGPGRAANQLSSNSTLIC